MKKRVIEFLKQEVGEPSDCRNKKSGSVSELASVNDRKDEVVRDLEER